MKRIPPILFVLLALACAMWSQNVAEMPSLEFGQTVEKEIEMEQKHSYKVHLEAGQFAKFDVLQKGCDVVLMVVAAENKNLVEIKNVVEEEGIETTNIAVETAGDYEFRIINFGENKGTYIAKIAELRTATLEEINFTSGWKLQNEGIKIQALNPTANAIEQAIGKFEQALEKFTLAKTVREQNASLHNMGTQYSRLGKRQKAIEIFQIVLQKHRALGRKREEAIVLQSIGGIYAALGKWQTALEYYAEAISTAKEANVDMVQIVSLSDIGAIYEKLNDFDKAEVYYLQSLEMAIGIKSAMYQAVAYNGLGKVYFYRNNYPKALEFFQKATEIEKESRDHRFEVLYLNSIGQTFFATGETEKSLQIFQQSLELSQKKGDKIKEGNTLRQIGNIYLKTNQLQKADEALLNSLAIYRQIEDPTNLAETLFALAKVKKQLGKFEESQTFIEEALKLTESFRSNVNLNELRDSFSAKLADYYGFYTELLMQRFAQDKSQNFSKLAWLAAERGRARSLLNLLNEANADIYEGVDKDLLTTEKETYNLLNLRLENLSRVLSGKNNPKQVETLRAEVENIRQNYQIAQAKIREKSPRYAALTQPQTISIGEVQNQLLDANTVLLSYSLGDEKSYLWLISKNNWQVFELPKRSEIEAKTRQVYQYLTARNAKIKFETAEEKQLRIDQADREFPKLSAELRQILLGSVENLITNKRLLIVADGALQYLPFASLANKKGYLIESNEIVNLPSASVLSVLRKENLSRNPAPQKIAVIADPVFDVTDERFTLAKNKSNSPNPLAVRSVKFNDLSRSIEDFNDGGLDIPRLPFTRKEADAITKFTSPNERKVALDFAATREFALSDELKNYQIIHFATHGLLNNKKPELSGLVFSLIDENGNPLNGFLRTEEVFNLKISADLVVLSGCRTGLGKEMRGEGLIGLTRGFMYAGASRILVSLWDVNDEATAELMSHFYQNLLEKRMKPAQALRQAQIISLKNKRFANPYYSMAFTLHGEF